MADDRSPSTEGESSRLTEVSEKTESSAKEVSSSRRPNTSDGFSCGHSVSKVVTKPAERAVERENRIGFEIGDCRRKSTAQSLQEGRKKAKQNNKTKQFLKKEKKQP